MLRSLSSSGTNISTPTKNEKKITPILSHFRSSNSKGWTMQSQMADCLIECIGHSIQVQWKSGQKGSFSYLKKHLDWVRVASFVKATTATVTPTVTFVMLKIQIMQKTFSYFLVLTTTVFTPFPSPPFLWLWASLLPITKKKKKIIKDFRSTKRFSLLKFLSRGWKFCDFHFTLTALIRLPFPSSALNEGYTRSGWKSLACKLMSVEGFQGKKKKKRL